MTVAKTVKSNNRKPEDRGFASRDIAIVADGVTRTPPPGTPYPEPSPAAKAAEVAVESLSIQLAASNPNLVDALSRTNDEIALLNDDLGLWSGFESGTDDLAGTVVAVVAVRGTNLEWAYLGDCGIALLDNRGAVTEITPDAIEPLRAEFPPTSEPAHLRMSWVREHFRNTESGRGFGVLTGEPAATRHIKSGKWVITSAVAAVVAFSDGARPALHDARLRKAILDPTVTNEQLSKALLRAAVDQRLTDEATLAIIRPGETKS